MTLEEVTGKNYISHSAMSTWLGCGWQYYLTRVQHVAESPSYWLAGGKAVHECTEIYDITPEGFDPTAMFVERWNHNYKMVDNGMHGVLVVVQLRHTLIKKMTFGGLTMDQKWLIILFNGGTIPSGLFTTVKATHHILKLNTM